MFKYTSKLYLFFVLLVSFSAPIFAQRIGDPQEKWQMLSTPHFEIFYSAQHQDLGLYYARIAELSYAEIMTIFTVAPEEKIVVILNDSTDAPNGFTTLLPYPYIMIYPVQAGRDDALAESAEWAKELFIHELAHIFQLYPAEDYFKYPRKYIFGNIFAPNLLLPLWWKEGMAVEIESRFTHQGRTRSYFQDAGIRALVLEKKLFSYSLAEANEMLPTWPYGSRPYLFGSMLMSEIGTKDNGKAINDLTLGHAARTPYFIEAPHERIFGYNYESHYLLTLDAYQRQAEKQLAQINSVSATVTTAVDSELISGRSPRFNYTGTTLGLVSMDKKGKKISFYNLDSENKIWSELKLKKAPSGEISSFEFHPNQNKLVFAKIDNVDIKRTFSDLYIFNLDEDKEIKITTAARARNPIWNNQGTMIYFISTANGKTQLKSFNINTETTDQLLEIGYVDRLHEISLYNDRELFVGIKDSKGNIQPKIFNLETHNLTDLKIMAPEVEHLKNRFGKIYFTSVKNGVPNIYFLNKNEEIAVTNFQTGALDFDISKNNTAVVTLHTAKGFEVHSFDLGAYKTLPKISNQFRDRYKYTDRTAPEFEQTIEEPKVLKYLYPHYWIPFVATSSVNNSVFIQAVTGSQDPLLIHRYNLAVDYDSLIKKIGFNFDYVNSVFNWPLVLSANRNFTPIGSTNVFVERSQAALGFVPDTFKLSSRITVNAGLQFSEVDQYDLRTQHIGPYLQFGYRNVDQTIFDIYPRQGWGTFLQFENQKTTDKNALEGLGDYDQVTGSILGYNSYWLPKDHSLYAKINFVHTFQKVSTRFGPSNSILPTFTDSTTPDFVLRGYTAGQFFGSRMATINTEYRFPLKSLNQGSGTYPYYLKRINAAFLVDGLTVSGRAFDKNNILKAENMSQSFWSAGAEIRLESTLGYLLPVNFIFGYYRPLSGGYAIDTEQVGFSLQLGGGIPGRQGFNH